MNIADTNRIYIDINYLKILKRGDLCEISTC